MEGMITLISYSTPMVTENTAVPGIAYWLPPMMPTPFSGEKSRRKAVIQTFRSSKITAGKTKSVQLKSLFPASFLAAFLTALEARNWKFKELKADRSLQQRLFKVTDEIFTGLENQHSTKRPLPFRFAASPVIIRILLTLAPKVMPMDIETYFEAHFTKVKSQTKLYMQNYLDAARKAGGPHAELEYFNKLT